MKILFAASEAVPFIKSGGLADVAGSLSRALRARRQTCRVVLPLYADISQEDRDKMRYITNFQVPLGWRSQYCGLFEATAGGVKYYFLDNEYYFRRHGLYGFFDDGERFAFFSRAVLEMIDHIDFEPDIIHCNDWQTAMVPVFLNLFYRDRERHSNLKTVFTIHNIQYQGTYSMDVANEVLGLPQSAFRIVEYNKDVNYMKGALEECDVITTVSPSYAHEILDPWFGHGLDVILRDKQYKLFGILNGLDNQAYDPKTDSVLFENYTAASPKGKAVNKQELQRMMGLTPDPKAMLIGMVGRLVSHKGMDLVQFAFSRLMREGIQCVVLGTGDWQYEKFLREMAGYHQGSFAVSLDFDDVLARRIYSGSDVFLMPSKSEPCGLAQMIALRYGTLPVVRATGGLKDTIIDLGGEGGNGYTFQTYNADDMLCAINRAFDDFQDEAKWAGYVKNAMKCDFGWGKSAAAYIDLYQNILGQQEE